MRALNAAPMLPVSLAICMVTLTSYGMTASSLSAAPFQRKTSRG